MRSETSKIALEFEQTASQSIGEAIALPFGVYTAPEVLALETKHIFQEDWIFVCAAGQLEDVGSYYALDIAGEAVAIIRQSSGELTVLSNVCRHRGTILLEPGFGRIEKNIICPYHAWTYSESGQLKGVPFSGNVQIDKSSHCLPKFHCEIWMGLVFVNLSDSPYPLKERFDYLQDYLGIYEPERFTNCYTGDTDSWKANWKLAVENGIESYHLFKVHKETLETVTPSRDAYYVAGSSEWAITGGKMKSSENRFLKWLTGETPEAYNHYLLVFLPPNFIGILTYESFDWICILPVSENECVITSGGMSEKKNSSDSYTQEFVKQFMYEDKLICERVQAGMSSQLSSGGKLVEMEKILVDFRQYLASRIFNHSPEAFYESEHASIFYNVPDG